MLQKLYASQSGAVVWRVQQASNVDRDGADGSRYQSHHLFAPSTHLTIDSLALTPGCLLDYLRANQDVQHRPEILHYMTVQV